MCLHLPLPSMITWSDRVKNMSYFQDQIKRRNWDREEKASLTNEPADSKQPGAVAHGLYATPPSCYQINPQRLWSIARGGIQFCGTRTIGSIV